jgi:hypothetical protein
MRPDAVHTSIYLPEAVHEALREATSKERGKIYDIIMERRIGLALQKRDYLAMEDLKSRCAGQGAPMTAALLAFAG